MPPAQTSADDLGATTSSQMELPWSEYLAVDGVVDEGRLRTGVRAVLDQLIPVHRRGEAHRLVSPEVLWFSPAGVLNASRFAPSALGAPTDRVTSGFERFRAPEMAAGVSDAVSDCYSVGVLIFEAITGREVPEASHRGARSLSFAADIPGWSPDLARVMNQALALRRDQRFQNAAEMLAALGETDDRSEPVTRAIAPVTRATAPDASDAVIEPPPPRSELASIELPSARAERPSMEATTVPSDQAGLFAKPDAECARVVSNALTCVGASVRGPAAALAGEYRSDDFAISVVQPSGWHVFVVAGGVGSAELSRRGSQIMCECASAALTRVLGRPNALDGALARYAEGSVPDGVHDIRQIASEIFSAAAYEAVIQVNRLAVAGGASLDDFSTTFISVLARPATTGWVLVAFSAGDGGAAVVENDENVLVLSHTWAEECNDHTTSIATLGLFNDPQDLIARTSVAFCPRLDVVALMTDGLRDRFFQSTAGFANPARWAYFRHMRSAEVDFGPSMTDPERRLLALLQSPSFGNDRDRTLILAFPNAAANLNA